MWQSCHKRYIKPSGNETPITNVHITQKQNLQGTLLEKPTGRHSVLKTDYKFDNHSTENKILLVFTIFIFFCFFHLQMGSDLSVQA